MGTVGPEPSSLRLNSDCLLFNGLAPMGLETRDERPRDFCYCRLRNQSMDHAEPRRARRPGGIENRESKIENSGANPFATKRHKNEGRGVDLSWAYRPSDLAWRGGRRQPSWQYPGAEMVRAPMGARKCAHRPSFLCLFVAIPCLGLWREFNSVLRFGASSAAHAPFGTSIVSLRQIERAR